VPIVVIVSPGASRDERQAWCSAGADECLAGMAGIDVLRRQVTGVT
jgi:hypothetical protein